MVLELFELVWKQPTGGVYLVPVGVERGKEPRGLITKIIHHYVSLWVLHFLFIIIFKLQLLCWLSTWCKFNFFVALLAVCFLAAPKHSALHILHSFQELLAFISSADVCHRKIVLLIVEFSLVPKQAGHLQFVLDCHGILLFLVFFEALLVFIFLNSLFVAGELVLHAGRPLLHQLSLTRLECFVALNAWVRLMRRFKITH